MTAKDRDRSQSSVPGSKVGRLPDKPIDLDDVLVNEIGQFGWFQLRNILLVSLPIMMSAFFSEYVFSAANIPYRCLIPECDGSSPVYAADWAPLAAPAGDQCQRYAANTTAAAAVNSTAAAGVCGAERFTDTLEGCDGYVYERTNSVVYEFGLECQEWLRALAGTLNAVGTLLVLPVTGYVSDRYGRRVALILNVFNLGLFGLIRAFSVNYPMYLAMHLVQTTLGAGTFSTAYVFATELVGPKYRVATGAVCLSMFATGQMILGAVAWAVQPWRYLIMVLHIPCFIIIGYHWVLSESVRWLLSKQRNEEARDLLQNVAKVNGKTISEQSLDALTSAAASITEKLPEEPRPGLLKAVCGSRVLLRRVCTTPVWWITGIFVYYGLSINSVGLSGNIYANYIAVCAVEIPGFMGSLLVLDRVGRKRTLAGGFFCCAACNLAFVFISNDLETLRLVFFLLGKFCIALVLSTTYLYTSELYPTEYRHSLLGFSSMVGRVGSISAPLTPALMVYWAGIPCSLFAALSVLSGVLALTQPETRDAVMPNTLAEAEALGRPGEQA